ncbi:MAG: hypothetical protein LUE93_06025 [Bacteroides sp.]|nr:hypothetical protein [Bacteroides sp.]
MLWDGTGSKKVTSPHTVDTNRFGVYNLFSIDKKGFRSDLSNPVIIAPDTYRYEAEDADHTGQSANDHSGYSGRGFVRDYTSKPANLTFQIEIPEGKAGKYAMKIVGANGYGPHEIYCMIRSVLIDRKDAGTFILEASGDWTRWLNSNYIFTDNLSAGKHTIELKLNPEDKGWDSNMSRTRENINDAHIDYLEVIRIN